MRSIQSWCQKYANGYCARGKVLRMRSRRAQKQGLSNAQFILGGMPSVPANTCNEDDSHKPMHLYHEAAEQGSDDVAVHILVSAY